MFKLTLLDTNFKRLGSIQQYISLTWIERYHDFGSFSLILQETDPIIALLQQGFYLYRHDLKTAMIIRYIKIDTSNRQLLIQGFSTLELFSQRGIDETATIINVENDSIETLQTYLRGLPYIHFEIQGFDDKITRLQFSQVTLDNFLYQISIKTELGLRMTLDIENKRHVFSFFKGIDRTAEQSANPRAIFSDEFGNISNLKILDDMSEFKNVAYVYGSGEGDERIRVVVGAIESTGLDRFEMFVDARDLQYDPESQTLEQYKEILSNRGLLKLAETVHIKNFETEIDDLQINKVFTLGDIVTCNSAKYNVIMNVRITELKQIIEVSQKRTIITIGEPKKLLFESGV